ncbi:MAG: hypothetical protein Q8927_08305 [Bacteroidota bacterium]|nr:hypothetical protein [Bacteroidota bacterium]MDP4216189.1 hypothetical protein [Bacteroidota bacterium]MDP4244406.1 hypothetical protein [Bacteroidota bacterium]MDP4256408.1 hypothetical protein [Bacteroidota bacterium]MDP4259785.1 hypothetical protein [Bacteroidota bacterium]
MAEQEVIKHTKKIYKIWSSTEHSFWHKLREFLLEVFIIVFAVSLSIWFHNRSEHAQQQAEVRQFMLGLKSDLQHDVAEMKSDRESYEQQQAGFTYLAALRLNQRVSRDSLNKYYNWLFNTTSLNPNNGRFEGFKASGKIGQIEDSELQNDILDLYQEDIVSLLNSTDSYILSKRKFFDYVVMNRRRLTDSTDNVTDILARDEGQSIAIALSSPGQVLDRYDKCIAKARKIISEIDEEYHLDQKD